MRKLYTLSLGVLVAAAMSIPAGAQEPAPEPVTIPETVQIDDPVGDANGLNDQGNRADTGFQGDHSTPADAGSVSDILKVWFSNDAENVSVHIQTELPAPASTAIAYNLYANPTEDWALGCLRFVALIPGTYQGQSTTYQGEPLIKLVDRCNDEGTNVFNNGVEGTYVVAPGPEDTGVLSLTFPRAYSPLLADGLPITKPFVQAATAIGADGAGFATPVILDNTADGTDYTVVTEVTEKPVKKGCKKGSPKAKKKGCKKP